MTIEKRSFTTEFEVRGKRGTGGGVIVTGHGAVFNVLSRNLGGFVERIDPGAFKQTLGNNPDVRALINHDPMHILGRTRSGTLRLSTDSTGLAYEIDMPDRSDARDLEISMERGDITQSSFAFYVSRGGDEWGETEDGFPLRTIRNVSLNDGDVSPVTYPAYPDADSGVRERAFRSFAAAHELPLDVVNEETLIKLIRGDVGELMDKIEERNEEIGETGPIIPAWLDRLPLFRGLYNNG